MDYYSPTPAEVLRDAEREYQAALTQYKKEQKKAKKKKPADK